MALQGLLAAPGDYAISPTGRWRPTDFDFDSPQPDSARPSSAPSRGPAVKENATKLRMLNPLHAGTPASEASKLRSVVEALFYVRYNAATSHVPAQRELASLLNTTDGVKKFLESEPSLSWAASYAKIVMKLLRKRAGGKHQAVPSNLPPMGGGVDDKSAAGGMRRSRSAASALNAMGRLPPMGGGGVASAAALFDAKPDPMPPTWEANARLAGIDASMAHSISGRVRELAILGDFSTAWLIVETCRKCKEQMVSFRHSEQLFISRFEIMKESIGKVFSSLPVHYLVPPDEDSSVARFTPIRIGAFEVYLCFPGPSVPFGAVSLPLMEIAGAEEHSGQALAKGGFSAVCLASKLKTLTFPSPHDVICRLASALPRMPVTVSVHTRAGMPVPGVSIEVVPTHEMLRADPCRRASGKTNLEGEAVVPVLPCIDLQMTVWHDHLMEPQQRDLFVAGADQREEFETETVVQLWRAEEGHELVIYRSSPRAGLDPKYFENLRPFKGRLLDASGQIIFRCDPQGMVRGEHSLLAGVAKVAYKGWKSGIPHAPVHDVEDPPGLLEYARLSAPPIVITVPTRCCGSNLPQADIAIDDASGIVGSTGMDARAVKCHAKSGGHTLHVRSKMLEEDLSMPFTVGGMDGFKVEAQLPLTCFRFVCVSRNHASGGLHEAFDGRRQTPNTPGSSGSSPNSAGRRSCPAVGTISRPRRSVQRGSLPGMFPSTDVAPQQKRVADLWLVGGHLSDWKSLFGGPRHDSEVWMWNGQLSGSEGPPLEVASGILSEVPETIADSGCLLTQALAAPVSQAMGLHGLMPVTLMPTRDSSECCVCHMAQMRGGAPAMWLGRLESEDIKNSAAKDNESAKALHVMLHTTCCGRGFSSATLRVSGQESLQFDEDGSCKIEQGLENSDDKLLDLQIDGIPTCLLPGDCHKYEARCKRKGTTAVDLDISCKLWLWWVPPGEEDEESYAMSQTPKSQLSSPKSEPGDKVLESQLWLAADKEHLPDNARPLKGMLMCPGAEEKQCLLDGSMTGPYHLRQSPAASGNDKPNILERCLLAEMCLHAEPPAGFEFIPRDPSPLLERCQEIGGCELTRLASCPVVLGYYRQIQPPPVHLSLTTSCCCRGWPQAIAALEGHTVFPKAFDSAGRARLSRRIPEADIDLDAKEDLQLCIDMVPEHLLPHESREQSITAGLYEPVDWKLQILCRFWAYWIPPEQEEYEVDENGLLKELAEGEVVVPLAGPVFIAADADQIPDEARPVSGLIKAPNADVPEMRSDGIRFGPFLLQQPREKQDAAIENTSRDSSGAGDQGASFTDSEEKCLLADMSLDLTAPQGYYWRAKEPAPLAARCIDLGGCELQRLIDCPVAFGSFTQIDPAPLVVSCRSRCCKRAFTGARVTLHGHSAGTVKGDDLHLRRQRKSGRQSLEVSVGNVPEDLLPSRCYIDDCHPYEPYSMDIEVSCSIWVYWMPPESIGNEREGDDDLPEGYLYIVADGNQVPKEAQPLQCAVECKGARESLIKIDGTSIGPFSITASDSLGDDSSCPLESLLIHVQPIEGFAYRPREPSPLAERCAEFGGCELQRLVERPVVMGFFSLVFPPPCRLSLRTTCCGRGFDGASAKLLDEESSASELVLFDESGCVEIPRKREFSKERCDLVVEVDKIPSCLLGNSNRLSATCQPAESVSMDLSISCLVYVYWTPPEVQEGETPEDAEDDAAASLAEGMVWVAVDVKHLPQDAQPLEGILSCTGAETPKHELDGSTTGPFLIRRPKGMESDTCLLSKLVLDVPTSPVGYEFRAKEPAPLAERCDELGGCELQRIAQCPMAIGYLKPLVPPPLELALRTRCCSSCMPGASISHNGKDPVPVEDPTGLIKFDRQRDEASHEFQITGIPQLNLPGEKSHQEIHCQPFQEVQLPLDVKCLLWVYWVPPEAPEESEEEKAEGEDFDEEPAEGILFVSADPEQIPDEAKPLSCVLSCPFSCHLAASVETDGNSMGPYEVGYEERLPFPGTSPEQSSRYDRCMLADLLISVPTPPEGYEFRAKESSPLLERYEELGGCELSRLLECPVSMGYLRPVWDRQVTTSSKASK